MTSCIYINPKGYQLHVGCMVDAKDHAGNERHKWSILNLSGLDHHNKENFKSYLRMDIPDDPQFALARVFPAYVKYIHNQLSQGHVLVYCFMGMSRSVTVVTAYVMNILQYTAEQALHYVKKRHSVSSPNIGFRRELKEYELRQARDRKKALP